ncbi:hypothetical protein ACFELO_00215 [Oceanicaulis sp. LC35]|uniref:hypothetical protein n=1 Tax=Oceanicaulis sp. LC35 TaxID=3349635 RepID=UPI003F839A8D
MVRITLGLTALLLATACSDSVDATAPSEPAAAQSVATGEFEIGTSYDASGYFVPMNDIAVAGWSIDHIFVGHSTDFMFWREAGENPDEIPVWLSLNPVGGDTAINEMGSTYFVDNRRIRPHDLTLTDGAFEFRAHDGELGDILISGMIQADALQEPGDIPQSDPPAMTVGLEMGGEHIRNASFMHWLGD